MMMLEKGLIQLYTSQSGKYNFAPIGLSLRAAGQNLRILITCFMPHDLMNNEVQVASFLLPRNLIVNHAAIEGVHPRGVLSKDKILKAFYAAKAATQEGNFDMVILNGILQVINLGMLPVESVLDLIQEKPPHVEIVLTGQEAPKTLVDAADLVTEMVVSPYGRPDGPEQYLEPFGSIEVITGNGKGKTTYCLGKAMLASRLGFRSAFLQFIKSPKPYGEVKAIARFPHLEIKTMGEGFLDLHTPNHDKRHLQAARFAWEKCLKEIFSLKYGLIVLDELNTATHYGLVNPERVREMLFLKPQNLHLLISGRHAHSLITGLASNVLEMREIKHPYKQGIKARKGIEF
jgi:cob(I)alamin adenosyltransferase